MATPNYEDASIDKIINLKILILCLENPINLNPYCSLYEFSGVNFCVIKKVVKIIKTICKSFLWTDVTNVTKKDLLA